VADLRGGAIAPPKDRPKKKLGTQNVKQLLKHFLLQNVVSFAPRTPAELHFAFITSSRNSKHGQFGLQTQAEKQLSIKTFQSSLRSGCLVAETSRGKMSLLIPPLAVAPLLFWSQNHSVKKRKLSASGGENSNHRLLPH